MFKHILYFPKNFYWGSSTSAHQVEGGNFNDWTEWEKENAERLAREAKNKYQSWQIKKFPEMLTPENYVSSRACDHYNRYEEDFDIARSLGHNAHRFSLEWSRIEPEEGKFNEEAIEHYRKMLEVLKRCGLEPFITIWHWTLPLWMAKKGGIESDEFPRRFSLFAERIAKEFKKEVKFWITINEPTVILANSYLLGIWPPQKKDVFSFSKVYKNLAETHVKSYQAIHKIDPNCQVGLVHNVKFIEPKYWFCVFDQLASRIYRYLSNDKILKMIADNCDFIGCNYYFHDKIRFYVGRVKTNEETTDMNWEIYPEGMYRVLKDLQKYDKPIYITENGLADEEDMKRNRFIKEHLYWAHKAIVEGVDVRGYFHWSLLDNFEWDKGFWPRFGLVAVDRKTLKRTVRKSAWEYAKICKSNSLNF